MHNSNEDVLREFAAYCEANPEQRFWQALRNWSGASFVLVRFPESEEAVDTFYWTGKRP